MTRRVLVLGAVVLLLAAGGIVAFRAGHPVHAARYRLTGTVVWPAGTRPAPAFALRDQDGRVISRKALLGHVWAVTFLDSNCRKACPVAARDLARVQQTLGAHNPMVVVIVSVLPQYDTPAHVRAFARKAGLTDGWHWLLGTQRQLSPVWGEYGIWVKTGVEHTAALYLVDQQGNVRVADAVPFIPRQLADSVRALSGA